MKNLKIKTKDSVELEGFLIEPENSSSCAIVFIHGWKDSAFVPSFVKSIAEGAAKAGISSFAFNNRGAGALGETEKFEDCILDIEAAVRLLKNSGYPIIYLVGHSTGCQKAAYYAHKGKEAKGIAFVEPTDDVALAISKLGNEYERAISLARELTDSGKGNELMPEWSLVGGPASAERYLSMFSKERNEGRIFDFSGKLELISTIGQNVLCIYGSESRYSEDAGGKLERLMYRMENATIYLEEGADHEFVGFEEKLAKLIIGWILEKERLA